MAFERKPPRGGKPGGKSFGGKSGGGGGFKKSFGDKPRGRSFDGDRPKRDFGDRPARPRGDFGDRPARPRRDGDDRPSRPRGEFSDRPKRDFGDRPKRDFGDRPSRPRGEFSDRPKRDFGDRPSRPRGEFSDRPKRDFGDRPKRDFGDRPSRPRGDFGDRPKRDFGDRPARPRRDFDGDRPSRPRREEGGDHAFAPRRFKDDGDRKPRGDFDDRPRKTYERRAPRDDAAGDMQGHELVVYGVHAVQAALRNENRKVTAIWVTDIGHEKLAEAFDAARHPEPTVLERRDIERKLHEGAVHQGLAAAVEHLPEVFLMDIVAAANNAPNERHVVVILDEVTDPHNVGAVLRSMSAFGAKAMITHKHNAPKVTGVMAKIATGAMEHVPMIPVVNISGAMTELKNAGFFILGLDENADYDLAKAPSDGHICLVLGAEGEGLRALTRKTCDAIASIPTLGDIKSLNVSNAAAISLYAVTQKKD